MSDLKVTIAFDRDGKHCSTTEHSPYEALRYIVGSEFGFSGMLTELKETKVTVETMVMGCRDLSVFTGTKEAMALVYKASCIYAKIVSEALKKGSFFSTYEVQLIQKLTSGNPFLIDVGAGIFAGASREKIVNLAMLNIKPEEFEQFAKYRLGDIQTLVEFKYNDNLCDETIREIASTL